MMQIVDDNGLATYAFRKEEVLINELFVSINITFKIRYLNLHQSIMKAYIYIDTTQLCRCAISSSFKLFV